MSQVTATSISRQLARRAIDADIYAGALQHMQYMDYCELADHTYDANAVLPDAFLLQIQGQLRAKRDAAQLKQLLAGMAKCIEIGTLRCDRLSEAEPDEQFYKRVLASVDFTLIRGSLDPSRMAFNMESNYLALRFILALVRDDVKLVVFDMDYTIVTMHSGGCLHGAASYEAFLSSPAANFVELIRYLYLHPFIDLQVAIATYSDFAYYFIDNPHFQQPESTDGKTRWAPSDNPVEGQFTGDFIVDEELEASMTALSDDEVKLPMTYVGAPEHYHNMLGGEHLVTRFLRRTFLRAFVDDTDRMVMTADEKKMNTYLEQIIIVARNPAIRASSDTSNHPYNVSGKTFHLKRIVEIHLQRNGMLPYETTYTKLEMAEAVHNYLWYHTILFDDSQTNIDFAVGEQYVRACLAGYDFAPMGLCRAFLVDASIGFVWNDYILRALYPLGTCDDFEGLYFPLTLP